MLARIVVRDYDVVVTNEANIPLKTPQGELFMHLYYPPDWKPSDQRPVIVFFFGGGWKNGAHTQFMPQSQTTMWS